MDKVLFPHKFAYVLFALTLPQASSVINRQLQAPAPPRVPLPLKLGYCLVLSVSILFIYLFVSLLFSLLQSYFSLDLPVPLLLSVYQTVPLFTVLFLSLHQLLGSILTPLSARAQTSPSRAALCHRDQKQLVSFLPVCALFPSLSLSIYSQSHRSLWHLCWRWVSERLLEIVHILFSCILKG